METAAFDAGAVERTDAVTRTHHSDSQMGFSNAWLLIAINSTHFLIV